MVEQEVEKLGLTQTLKVYLEDGTEISDVFGGLINDSPLFFDRKWSCK